MKIKEFLEATKQKRSEELEALAKRVEALEKINNESEDETELKAAGEELDALKAKKAELEKELADINSQIEDLDKPAEGEGERKHFNPNIMNRGANTMTNEEKLERAKKFKETNTATLETRSTLISSGDLATPTEVSGINDHFNEVSSIVDMVYVANCKGMSANRVAYEIADATAATKTEGSAATASDPSFDFVDIKPTSYAVLSYISDQVKKQTPLDYEAKVNMSAKNALRKKAAEVITSQVVKSTLATGVNGEVKSGKGVIDEKTLRKLTLAYGGNENVMGEAILFLNKEDLIAFGDVRGTNEKKAVYEITPDAANPNTGIIKDGGLAVKYCINSNCGVFNGTTQPLSTATDKKTMFYANPKCIELDLFGDYEIKVSEDYKFAENMLTIRGQVDLGADVTYKDGVVFLVLPKAAA